MATNGSDNPVTTPTAPTTQPAAVGTNNASPPTAGAAYVADHGWHPFRSLWGLMGYGRRGTLRRRHIFTLFFKLVLGIGQIVAIAVLSAISLHKESPTHPGQNEWDACDRPLGAWVMVWLVRVTCGLVVSIYSYYLISPGLLEYTYDPEHGVNSDAVQANQTPPPVGPLNGPGQPQFIHSGRVHPIPRPLQTLTTLLSLLSLVWFIASHILVYTSLNTCRHSSPHLWYLTFGIMCLAYLLIVEVIVVVFFLFFFVPILILLINVFLLCMGRQPIFRPNGMNHEIGKLPQQIVDRIPLVLYIPTPPPKDSKTTTGPEMAHTYPPTSAEPVPPILVKSPTSATKDSTAAPAPAPAPAPETANAPERRHRFFFFRRSAKPSANDLEAGKSNISKNASAKRKRRGTEDEWEANWERGDYPFVKLPENRASCAICLLDFEEPPRRGSIRPQSTAGSTTAAASNQGNDARESRIQIEPLALQDAGEGATPLRLLACGHVFHQTCLDPWLKDVSGRCPVCQKKVDIEELERLSKNGSSTAWATKIVTPTEQPKTSPGEGPSADPAGSAGSTSAT